MRRCSLLLGTSLLLLPLLSCADSQDNPLTSEPKEERVFPDESTDLQDLMRGPEAEGQGTGLLAPETPQAIPDPASYEIIFTDKYKDAFFLNLKRTDGDYYFYKGLWNCRYGDFDVAVLYKKSDKTIALSAFYKNETVMFYQMKYYANAPFSSTGVASELAEFAGYDGQYFNGEYGWLKATYATYYTITRMYVQLAKGAFPT